MRKTIVLILTIILALSVLAGCGNIKQELAIGASSLEAGGTRTVHNVDELISAIAPGAKIQLAEGTYNLAQSTSYGQRTNNPYVKWEECWNGFVLVVHDADNLTIAGSGKEHTKIISECSDADVLKFEDCTHLVLEGFTAGHTPQSEGCAAGVVSLFRTDDACLRHLGLYGCGAVGITAKQTKDMQIDQCEIYDCSHSGMDFINCQSITVDRSSIHNIGKAENSYDTGYAIITASGCSDVLLRDCEMTDSTLQVLLNVHDSEKMVFTGNRIVNNSTTQAMFTLANAGVVIESNNIFEDNAFSRWYDKLWDGSETAYAVNERGEKVFTEDPEPVHNSSEPVEPIPVITGEQKQIKVSTVDDFLAAIDSNTEIILTAPLYDLSTAADYGKPGNALHYSWNEEFDGWELVIMGVENFSIVGAEDEVKHTISAVPRYADVITFVNCKNIMVRGITAGHTVEPGYCAGGVLHYEYSTDIAVDKCNLYGCGILGVSTYRVDNMQITNSCIYECSQGGMMCMETKNLTVGGCTFWDLGGDTFQLSGCSGVIIDGKEIRGDYYGN